MSNDRKIAFASKFSFGVGQMAEGLKNAGFAWYCFYYYFQVLGTPSWMVTTALMVALIFDAVTDPLAGSLSDGWRSRFGRRHPFMYAAAVPLGIFFYFLFAPPAAVVEAGHVALTAWLTVFAILTRGAMTLYHVPHLALGAELTENYAERTSIVAYRQVCGVLGGVVATSLGFGYFLSDAAGGRNNSEAYPVLALTLSALMVVTIVWSAWGTRREIPFLPGPSEKTIKRNPMSQLWSDLGGAFQNRSFTWLFTGVLIVFLMVGVDQVLTTHMGQFFWDLSGRELLGLAVIAPIGLFVGALFTRSLTLRFGKRAVLIFGSAGWAILQTLPVALRLVDWFPENGSPALLPTLMAMRFAQGLIVQQALIVFGSMMADVADEHELESGMRQEGIFFGAVAFSGKASTGLGTGIAGVLTTLIAWPAGADIVSSADVPAHTLQNLGLIYGPGVCVFAAVSVWCYSKYHLTRERHEEILRELPKLRSERKAKREAEAAAAGAPVDPRATEAARLEPGGDRRARV